MATTLRSDPIRFLHIVMIGLQVFAVAQVLWWLIDQRTVAAEHAHHLRALYTYDVAAGQRLDAAGVAASEITALFPHLQVSGGVVGLKPEAVAAVEDAQHSRVNQYTWESGFFLLVLAAGIAVLWRGLSGEAEVRRKQDNFLAMVSHQFKTPLASLQLSLETMLRRQLSPERFQQLSHRMLDDLRRMENMVAKILDSARLDRGRVLLHRERIGMAEAVRHVLANVEDIAKRENVVFSMDIPLDLDLYADPVATDGVLRNLIDNAIAALGPTKGGTIAISGRRHGGAVEIAVKDSGIGFETADAERLFEKFVRLDTTGGRDAAGTGLGLYIVRRFMHFENGEAKAHSEGPGKGATFTVTWPAAVTQDVP
ncbi:MAG: sensor histidine kinase [Rhodospirillaceae bacterium]